MHAVELLAAEKVSSPPIAVLHGGERHLKQSSIRKLIAVRLGEGADTSTDVSRYEGKDADLRSVRDELMTVSMFAPTRVVVIEEADEFVSRHRAALEEYLDRPALSSLLILDVKSWPKNTRLAKRLPKVGLEVDCSELTGAQLAKWLVDRAASEGGKQLTWDAASLMIEMAGGGMSLLSQELDKLIAYSGDRDRITVEDVRAVVGGWRAQTTWEMINAVRDGQPSQAIDALDRLLASGEAPQRLLGGMTFTFRKLAEATERSRQGMPLRQALKAAGVFPRDADAVERYLRRVGRRRAERILDLLTEADAGLKGGSRLPERVLMERLLLALGGALPDEALVSG